MWGHIFITYNSPRGRVVTQVMSFYVASTSLFYIKTKTITYTWHRHNIIIIIIIFIPYLTQTQSDPLLILCTKFMQSLYNRSLNAGQSVNGVKKFIWQIIILKYEDFYGWIYYERWLNWDIIHINIYLLFFTYLVCNVLFLKFISYLPR